MWVEPLCGCIRKLDNFGAGRSSVDKCQVVPELSTALCFDDPASGL